MIIIYVNISKYWLVGMSKISKYMSDFFHLFICLLTVILGRDTRNHIVMPSLCWQKFVYT